jgi:hypothetical protein
MFQYSCLYDPVNPVEKTLCVPCLPKGRVYVLPKRESLSGSS